MPCLQASLPYPICATPTPIIVLHQPLFRRTWDAAPCPGSLRNTCSDGNSSSAVTQQDRCACGALLCCTPLCSTAPRRAAPCSAGLPPMPSQVRCPQRMACGRTAPPLPPPLLLIAPPPVLLMTTGDRPRTACTRSVHRCSPAPKGAALGPAAGGSWSPALPLGCSTVLSSHRTGGAACEAL